MKVKDILFGFLFLAVISSALILSSCGSGGAGVSDGGNSISGSIKLSGDTASARVNALEESATSGEPYSGAIVQLLDSEGAIVSETVADENGDFTFSGVAEGDYTIVVMDPETDEAVTEVDVSILDGDDALIEGVISSSETDWSVEFTANSADLQNDAQNQKAVNIAENSDATLDEVLALREGGMGWGQIAQQLGVHPSNLGLGNSDGFEKDKKTETNEENLGSSSTGNGKQDKGEKKDKPDRPNKPGKPKG